MFKLKDRGRMNAERCTAQGVTCLIDPSKEWNKETSLESFCIQGSGIIEFQGVCEGIFNEMHADCSSDKQDVGN